MNWKGVAGSSHRVILCNCSRILIARLGKTTIKEKKNMGIIEAHNKLVKMYKLKVTAKTGRIIPGF
jgi:hypothetical protein